MPRIQNKMEIVAAEGAMQTKCFGVRKGEGLSGKAEQKPGCIDWTAALSVPLRLKERRSGKPLEKAGVGKADKERGTDFWQAP